VQNRTTVARGKIAEGAIQALAHTGVEGLTHRAVARAAGVSLAATTYHFDTKADIIEEASRTLLDGYLAAFRRMAGRIAAREETRFANLDDLVERIVLNALGRERTRSLAWSELILHGGRSPAGRELTRRWYEQLDAIWYEIGGIIERGASRQRASAAIDLVVGFTFFLHPLGLDQPTVIDLLTGRLDPAPLLRRISRSANGGRSQSEDNELPKRHADRRQQLIDIAIAILAQEGAGGISFRRIAEAAGMVRSGPNYYFATIDELLSAAQSALFERAKDRYRAGLVSLKAADIDEPRLLDVTTAIYYREALEFGRENVGHYSVWMRAAQNPSLRPAVASSLLDTHRAWVQRIAVVRGPAAGATVATRMQAMRMQALFIGKLIRAIAASLDVADLFRAREDFAIALHHRAPATD
jgi:DNA-binding transcriptional regulator YbjK